MLMAALLRITWREIMVRDPACVGFPLPGMMEGPGSFSGSVSSPGPQRGPEASQRMSLAIFMSEAARAFSAPEAKTISWWAASPAKLLRCGRKGGGDGWTIWRSGPTQLAGGAVTLV